MNKLWVCLLFVAATIKPAAQAPSNKRIEHVARALLANHDVQQPTEEQVQAMKQSVIWSIWLEQQANQHCEKLRTNSLQFCTIL